MTVRSRKYRQQQEIVSKLIVLARGDIEIVRSAIWEVSKDGSPADLKKVVEAVIRRFPAAPEST